MGQKYLCFCIPNYCSINWPYIELEEIDVDSAYDEAIAICHNCEKLATRFCKTCDNNLCRYCIVEHYKNKSFTKDHEMIPL